MFLFTVLLYKVDSNSQLKAQFNIKEACHTFLQYDN